LLLGLYLVECSNVHRLNIFLKGSNCFLKEINTNKIINNNSITLIVYDFERVMR